MKLRIAAALIAILFFVTLTPAQSYDIDLAVQSITFAPLQNGRWLVTVTYGVGLDATAPDFSFTRRIEIYRNGVSLQVLDNSSVSVVNKTNCISCNAPCSGSCEVTLDNQNTSGTCKRTGSGFCDPAQTIKKCACNVSTSKTVVFDVWSGDTISCSLVPEPGVVDSDPSNNNLSATL